METLRNRVQLGSGNDGEGTWDPSVPPEKQVVRYQTKSGEIKTVTKAELQDQLEQSEKIMSSLNESWEEKLEKTQEIQREREKALEELGISVDKGNVGVHTPKKLPHLVNLNEDPLMSECLIYQLKEGKTTVGNLDSDKDAQIRLSGENILPEHCYFENSEGTVTINASQDSMTMVNGKRVKPDEPRRLRSGYRVILGDFHVFRFNNPEEVRRARDKVKSTLAMSTGEGDNETLGRETDSPRPGSTRPDSPASEEGADMDWTYARREAALARLSGKDVDFDKLNENDLDKLFEDISRARSKKSGRPESRMSFFDDGASESASSNINRPYSLSTYTDDTSVDPWQGSEPGSIRANGMTNTPPPTQSAEAAKETADLKLKVKEYEEKIHQINLAKQEEVIDYTEEQKRLIRWTIKQWRSETTVSMAEDVLSHAVLLKEANVLSKQLGKKAVYQFTIIDDGALSNPTSAIDTQTIAGLGAGELDDVQDYELTNSPKPCVAIRVLDHSRGSIHIWSLSKLEQRLQKMRNLYTFIDRPEYSRHFDWADPFYESSSSNSDDPSSSTSSSPFAFVGSALIPLKPLARKISAKYEKVPIRSRDTNSIIASCNVELKFISISQPSSKQTNGKSKANGNGTPSRNGALSPTGSDSRASSIQELQSFDEDLPSGHKLGVQLTVDSVRGLNESHFSSVHLQARLSSLAGPTIPSDDVYTSTPVDLQPNQGDSDPGLRLRKTISFIVTPEISSYIRDGYAPIEMYARVKHSYLSELEKYDAEREGLDNNSAKSITNGNGEEIDSSRPKLSHSRTGSSGAISLAPSTSRVSETEMVSEEKHDVLSSIQICELNANGEYEPVQVKATSSLDPGCFFLRQGLQRKMVIKLSHDSGKQFVWKSVTKIELGEVRLLDAKGRIHVSTTSDPIILKTPLRQQTVDFNHNGTSELESWSWWDSSVHDSIFLNRLTSSGQRVLLKLNIYVDFERASSPAKFELDIAVSINARDAKPTGKFFSMIESVSNGSKNLSKTTALFNVKLTPPLTKKTKELWRLDTGKKYVRGQEIIKDWKPRGVSLIHDHRKLLDGERKRAEVEGVRALLKSKPPLSLASNHLNGNGCNIGHETEWESEGERAMRDEASLQHKALDLWMRAVRDAKVVSFNRKDQHSSSHVLNSSFFPSLSPTP